MITKRLDKSLSQLIKEADTVFSRYIRTKDSVNGYCNCFICGSTLLISKMHNGHYITRDKMPTRYDEMNCHPVCPECNCFDIDHAEKYTQIMVDRYGLFAVTILVVKSRGLAKFARNELLELIDTYKNKLKELR